MNLVYENRKYRGIRLNIIFENGKILVGEGYPPELRFIGEFDPADFLPWLETAAAIRATPHARPPSPVLDDFAEDIPDLFLDI